MVPKPLLVGLFEALSEPLDEPVSLSSERRNGTLEPLAIFLGQIVLSLALIMVVGGARVSPPPSLGIEIIFLLAEAPLQGTHQAGKERWRGLESQTLPFLSHSVFISLESQVARSDIFSLGNVLLFSLFFMHITISCWGRE